MWHNTIRNEQSLNGSCKVKLHGGLGDRENQCLNNGLRIHTHTKRPDE